MRTPLIALTLLLTATAVRADMGVPWEKSIERRVTLEIVKPEPGYSFFLVCGRTAEPIPNSGVYTLRASESKVAYWSRYFPLRICAVPTELLKDFPDKSPDGEWFEKYADQSRLRWSQNLGSLTVIAPVTDPRQSIEQLYRVEQNPTEVKLELIEERVEKKLPSILVVGGGCLLSVLTVLAAVVWLWRKRLTRTIPPLL